MFWFINLILEGPEKELLQLAVFGELQALFPGVKVHIDLIGPAISHLRLGLQYIHIFLTCVCLSQATHVDLYATLLPPFVT